MSWSPVKNWVGRWNQIHIDSTQVTWSYRCNTEIGRSVKWPSIDQLFRLVKLSGSTWNKEWAGKAAPVVGCCNVPIGLQGADISQTAGKSPLGRFTSFTRHSLCLPATEIPAGLLVMCSTAQVCLQSVEEIKWAGVRARVRSLRLDQVHEPLAVVQASSWQRLCTCLATGTAPSTAHSITGDGLWLEA